MVRAHFSPPTSLFANPPPTPALHPRTELRHLPHVQAVALALSFNRADAHRRVAPPALNRQIVALEEELGLNLLERTTTRVRLTALKLLQVSLATPAPTAPATTKSRAPTFARAA